MDSRFFELISYLDGLRDAGAVGVYSLSEVKKSTYRLILQLLDKDKKENIDNSLRQNFDARMLERRFLNFVYYTYTLKI